MKSCFVTGAGGFIASYLVEQLVAEGCGVRALVRDPSRAKWLPAGGVEVLVGDLEDEAALSRGVQGVDVVYHLAALTRARTPAELQRTNVEGTARVVAACAAPTTPPKLVFVSSQAAGGPGGGGAPVDEQTPPRPASAYGASKLAAERIVEARAKDLPGVIVRPPSVYGPRDRAFLPLFRMARRRVVPIPRGLRALAMVHAEDLARGIRLCARRGSGTYYLTDGAHHDAREVAASIAEAVSARARVLTIPRPAFLAAVWAAEGVARMIGARAPLTLDRARDATAPNWTCSDARARRELGYASRRELREAMRETADWYRKAGWL
jgi:nucleoside-diphosphate-sugar epimerase